MSKHALFMVHGMGEQEDGWHKPAVKVLRKAWNESTKLKQKTGLSFDQFYEIVAYRFSNKFIEYWADYKDQAKKLSKLTIVPKLPIIKTLFNVAKAQPDNDNSLLTHWGDVLLYGATGYQELIPEEIVASLRDRNYNNYSVIAHSLGTRVMHDALQRAFSGDNVDYDMFGVPTVFLSAANVSRLMSFNTAEFEDRGSAEYKVFPSNRQREGCCTHYITARHKLDIIGSLRPFKMHHTRISNAFVAANYLNEALPYLDLMPTTRYGDLTNFMSDVHSLENHLSHPSVYVPLFNRSYDPSAKYEPLISNEEEDKLVQKYKVDTATGELLTNLKTIGL